MNEAPSPSPAIAEAKSSLFSHRPFTHLYILRLGSNTSNQMLAVVAAYQVYELTDSALHLGMIGLVQFLPPLVLMLLAGQVADRFNRRLILRCAFAVELSVAAALLLLAAQPRPSVEAIYMLLLINASARTFEQPVTQALLPAMIPRDLLSRAVPTIVFANRMAILLGPMIGGGLYLFGPAAAYAGCALLVAIAGVTSLRMDDVPMIGERPKVDFESLFGGFRFLWRCKPVLGAMTIDLLAVLFGATTMLLPIFARDILEIGPAGAGILRSSQAIGALLVAGVMARFPVVRHGGAAVLLGFAVYGLGTIVFGLSQIAALSVVALMVVGAGDMVSTVVRQTVIQITTPDHMRGRVFAVNQLFVGSSQQLGGFTSGTLAALIGAVPAVVVGGCAVVTTVALWAWLFPTLRRMDRPDEPQPY
jgi:MFS family permease